MQKHIFDTHAHYTSSWFDENRQNLLENLPNQGVEFVVDCGTDYDTSVQSLALAEKYSWMYTAVGIHPESLIQEEASTVYKYKGDWKAEMKDIMPLYQNEKVVAVGECGLDHHWPVPRDLQLALFEAEIRLALELDLPIIVHDREAHAEVYALLKKYKPKGVVHSYSGSVDDMQWIVGQGMYVGFTGVVTFKNAKKPLEVAGAVPIEYLVLETDCPYMAPVPFRGKQSNSGMIAYTAQKIAEVRGISVEMLLQQTLQNGKRLYEIEK